MSQLGTLHPFPRAQDARPADACALRSETPLDVPAAPPELAAIGGWQSLRLGAELALRSRWWFMVALAGVSLLSLPGLLSARGWAQQSAHAMVGLLVFTYGLARGVDGRSEQRAFWAGLGAAPASMELGVVLVDLLFMGAVTGAGWALGPEDPLFLLLGAGAGLVIYGLGSATRGAARSEAGRAGLVLAMLLVLLGNTVVAFLASYGHALIGLGVQLGIVTAAGLASRVLLSARAPESAAGRGRRRWGWLACALLGLLVVPLQFAQGKPDSTAPWGSATSPTEPGLHLPSRDPLASQQLWRVSEDGELERLSVRGRIAEWYSGPHGAVVVERRSPVDALLGASAASGTGSSPGGAHPRVPWHTGLVDAEGEHVECRQGVVAVAVSFDPTGLGADVTGEDGTVWRLDGDGCRVLAAGEAP